VQIGSPAELASLYAYLGSDEARYVTGTTVVMDGGITC
jgi:NAD(P)-dependent dehydrogenase (short-subunit alcohol dehydrogenase family)